MNNNMDSLYLAKRAVQRKLYSQKLAEARQRRHQFIPVEAMAEKLSIRKTKLIAYCIRNKILLTNDRRSGVLTLDKTALDRRMQSDPLSDSGLPEDEVIRSLTEKELSEDERQQSIVFLSNCHIEIR